MTHTATVFALPFFAYFNFFDDFKMNSVKRVSIQETPIGKSSAILDDFFNGGFQEIKETHQHKFKKHSASVSRPLPSALKPKTPGLGLGGAVHLGPLHTEDVHCVSDILHRVTLQPGWYAGIY